MDLGGFLVCSGMILGGKVWGLLGQSWKVFGLVMVLGGSGGDLGCFWASLGQGLGALKGP